MERRTLPGARDDRLYFAQVREDPLLEIAALAPTPDDTVVVVGSGGCTALSLLATGARRVVAVDVNRTQNHLVELKAAAVAGLLPAAAVAFLGGAAMGSRDRREIYQTLRGDLTDGARAYWDAHRRAVGAGVITSGVSERFIGLVTGLLRLAIHPPSRVRRLLACRSLEEQRDFYDRVWNTRRWRGLFALLLNRWAFRRAFHPAFFEHVENPSFARHFLGLAEHGLTQLPVTTNYFLHQMLTGRYPETSGGLPPYLDGDGARAVASRRGRLTLVDGTYTDYLRSCPDGSVSAFALSNIAEWLGPAEIDALCAEVARTATPGARVCFRNFVGWTEVPERWRDVIVEDRPRGDALIRQDRSLVQRRLAVCTVHRRPSRRPPSERPAVAVREARPADNPALLALATACPMEGDVSLRVDRAPDFFALNRLEGDRWQVAVAEDRSGTVVGCVALAERRAYLNGQAARTFYVSDLKVHPDHRGRGVADALTSHVQDVCRGLGGRDAPVLLTILAGNRAMERRTSGPRGLSPMTRVATVRVHSLPLLWPRRRRVDGLTVAPAGTQDLEEMAVLWRQVAPERQLAPVLDAARLLSWIDAVPGLTPASYLLARRRDGRLAGFLAVWDPGSVKQLRVTAYSRRLAALRLGFNLVAPAVGAAVLPPPGAALKGLAALHVCAPAGDPAVLRALVLDAYARWRGRGYSFLTVALDRRDRLSAALGGLLAQPTDVNAYLSAPGGAYQGPPFDARPLHFESALV